MVDAVISQPYLVVNSEKDWEGFPNILQICTHPLLPVAKQHPLCTPFPTDLRADPTHSYTQQLFSLGCTHGRHSSLLFISSSSSLKSPELTPRRQCLGGSHASSPAGRSIPLRGAQSMQLV